MQRTPSEFGRVLFTDLTPDQYEAAKQFLIREGMAWEDSDEDPTWVAPVNAKDSQLTDLEAALS